MLKTAKGLTPLMPKGAMYMMVSGPFNLEVVYISYKYSRAEVFTAVTMKNTAFWDIKSLFVPHRRHITPPLQSSAG
jgi:hypothetical protein